METKNYQNLKAFMAAVENKKINWMLIEKIENAGYMVTGLSEYVRLNVSSKTKKEILKNIPLELKPKVFYFKKAALEKTRKFIKRFGLKTVPTGFAASLLYLSEKRCVPKQFIVDYFLTLDEDAETAEKALAELESLGLVIQRGQAPNITYSWGR